MLMLISVQSDACPTLESWRSRPWMSPCLPVATSRWTKNSRNLAKFGSKHWKIIYFKETNSNFVFSVEKIKHFIFRMKLQRMKMLSIDRCLVCFLEIICFSWKTFIIFRLNTTRGHSGWSLPTRRASTGWPWRTWPGSRGPSWARTGSWGNCELCESVWAGTSQSERFVVTFSANFDHK